MRKIALALVLLLAVSLLALADDGTVLPAGVFRARVIPAYGWMPGAYDNNGNYTAFSSSTMIPYSAITTPNLGFSLEYGVNDWVTVGLQWAPGLTFASSIPAPPGFPVSFNVNGASDLFAGVMVQIVGPKAPVASDVIRFDLAPGVKIPLGLVDLYTQTGTAITYSPPDIPAFGIGGRAYLDYVFNKSFFLDLYAQFIDYPIGTDVKYLTADDSGYDVGYGYTLRIELDPHYSIPLSDGLILSANCAFRYDATPDLTFAGTTAPDTHTSLFSANPSVAVFFTKFVVPIELQLDYGQPITGINTYASYSLDLQVKVYFKL
jgi:hypothetical protein